VPKHALQCSSEDRTAYFRSPISEQPEKAINQGVFRKISKYTLTAIDRECTFYLEKRLNNFSGRRMRMAFAETFKALSDPVRRQILELLKKGPLSAGEIGSHFEMTGATISYHLKILKKADLIFESREKNFIYYQLNTSVLEEIMLWISGLNGGNSDVESK
jgi:DNA-binding transcriptional ArsR family regulator